MCALQGIPDLSPASDERVALLVASKIPGFCLWHEGRWRCSCTSPGWDGSLPIYANTAALAVCRAFAACYLYDESGPAVRSSQVATPPTSAMVQFSSFTRGEPPIGDQPGLPVVGQEREDIAPKTHAILIGLIARGAGGDAKYLVDAEMLLECFYGDLEQFVASRWYPVAHRDPGWQESSGYYMYLLGAYIQLARTVCQARLLADLGHLQEWEYLRWMAARDGYSLTVAIEAARILLQGEDRRWKESYEQGFAYLNIAIEPDEQEHRAICHLLGLTYSVPDPPDGMRWGTWTLSTSGSGEQQEVQS
jgi:hypothetical protein